MKNQWSRRSVLIVVRTYPVPAHKGIEVSCTAAVTDDGKWMRLFPVPYRFLENDRRFKKYQWIDVDVVRASNDPRPESYKLNPDSIIIKSSVPQANAWRERRRILQPLFKPSMCAIRREREQHGAPTLGIFKPKTIKRLAIEPTAAQWTGKELGYLRQIDIFRASPKNELEKLSYNFKYDFDCPEPGCSGHSMMCTDWEMGAAYRRWRQDYGADWEKPFRNRFEAEMINKNYTHFYVGTIHQHLGSWIVIGLFYPPHDLTPEFVF